LSSVGWPYPLQPGGAQREPAAVVEGLQAPAALVDEVMMCFTHEREILQVGGSDGVFEQVVPPDDTN
jgi:hypothetical protein